MKTKLLIILGPTATGKSDLAVELALKFNGEIISADSRQVYKGLDIGSGKITELEMQGIPHHLLDVASPQDQFTVTDFVKLSEIEITNIVARDKIPIICGGTGFYIQALVDGISIPEVPPNEELRSELEKLDTNKLFERLSILDPVRAEIIDKDNPRRLIRAIEIATALGKVPVLNERIDKYETIFIGLNLESEEIKERIKKRLLKRLEIGMLDEAIKLNKNGLSWQRMEDLGLEYRYMAYFLQNKISKDEMIEQLNMAIWHYAKRQMTWFKRDNRIKWFRPSETESIVSYVGEKIIFL